MAWDNTLPPSNRTVDDPDPADDHNQTITALDEVRDKLGDLPDLTDGQLLEWDAINNRLIPAVGDKAADTASLRTLGTGAQQAAAGKDTDDALDMRAPKTALHLPGTSGNYVSTPDHADVSITGDLDLRVEAGPPWAESFMALIGKYDSSVDERGYLLRRSNTGGLELFLSEDGTGATDTSSSEALANDAPIQWVRVTWRASDGRVQFFTSDDGETWTQLGTDKSISITDIHNSTAALAVGANNDGANNPMKGPLLRAEVYDGIDGTLAADLDCRAPTSPRFRDSTGKVWTFNGSEWTWEVA